MKHIRSGDFLWLGLRSHPVRSHGLFHRKPQLIKSLLLTVGAGSAGCVLANRLSADGRFSVLVLEAGEEETKYPLMHIPIAAAQNYCQHDCMWEDLTVPQDYSQGFNDQVKFCV